MPPGKISAHMRQHDDPSHNETPSSVTERDRFLRRRRDRQRRVRRLLDEAAIADLDRRIARRQRDSAVRKLRALDVPLRTIARALSVSHETVRRICRDDGRD